MHMYSCVADPGAVLTRLSSAIMASARVRASKVQVAADEAPWAAVSADCRPVVDIDSLVETHTFLTQALSDKLPGVTLSDAQKRKAAVMLRRLRTGRAAAPKSATAAANLAFLRNEQQLWQPLR